MERLSPEVRKAAAELGIDPAVASEAYSAYWRCVRECLVPASLSGAKTLAEAGGDVYARVELDMIGSYSLRPKASGIFAQYLYRRMRRENMKRKHKEYF